MTIVRDPKGNIVQEGDEFAVNVPLGAAKIVKVAPIMDGGPLHGGTVIVGVVEIRWTVPPNGFITAFKIDKNQGTVLKPPGVDEVTKQA